MPSSPPVAWSPSSRLPTLGSKPLQAIKAADLTTLYARLLICGRADHAAGAPLSRRSVAYVATIVGKCLEAAVRGELLQANPARRAEVPKAAATATDHEAMRMWPREDLRRFLMHSREHRHYAAWLLLATTGLRRGEALGASWSALDLDKGRMQIRRTLVDVDHEKPVWSDPKTSRGRRQIALDPTTVSALRGLKRSQAAERLAAGAGYVDHDLVFCRADGKPLHPDRFSKGVRRAGDAARAAAAIDPRAAAHVGDAGLAGGRAPEGRSGAARSQHDKHHPRHLLARHAVDGDGCCRSCGCLDPRRRSMTQWLPALTALGGVALGFFLNLAAERRREAREDRIRFVQEKLCVYADLTNACKRAERLKEQIKAAEDRRELLIHQTKQLIEAHGPTALPSQVPGGAELEASAKAATALIGADCGGRGGRQGNGDRSQYARSLVARACPWSREASRRRCQQRRGHRGRLRQRAE